MKEYKPLKLPEGIQDGLIFNIASSRQLDVFGESTGLKRRKFLFIKEPDFLYKIRLKNLTIKQNIKEKL